MTIENRRLEHVSVVISSYRGSAAPLVRGLAERGIVDRFASVIVVDSGLSPDLKGLCDAAGVMLDSEPSMNLGSAGNLARRLYRASETSARWAFAVNHDGRIDYDTVAALTKIGDRLEENGEPVGAVFPRRRFPNRDNAYGAPARGVDLLWWRKGAEPTDGLTETCWSSSNAALYSLRPLRRGVLPWADFWMGWEDLAFGWALGDAGYRQFIANQVVLDDDYEYHTVRRGPIRLRLSNKPAWYEYYFARNLLFAASRTNRPLAAVAAKLATEVVLAATFRREPLHRLALLARGTLDGLKGRAGKADGIP